MIRSLRVHLTHSQGFSLTEVLVVTAILGILTAIAVPAINQYQADMRSSKARRNAQTVATIYAGAQATGLEFYDGTDDLTHLVKRVVAGGTVPDGPLEGQVLGVKGLSDEEVAEALPHLQFTVSQKRLLYTPDRISPAMAVVP